ncbi:MAG TPA: ABC transporter substrate-binding protein [Nocardioidaceae bacterium]|nr:ABC transporter substrate-binding protein [Nocardioidaceae bacterium]
MQMHTRPSRRAARSVLAAALMALVTACGSALGPSEVIRANEAARGQGGEVPPSTTQVPGTGAATPGAVATPGAGSGPGAGGGASTPGSQGGSQAGGTPGVQAPTGGTGGVKAASCQGFKNGPGITDSTITIGNAVDVSGPVPGLFEGAQQAVKAYVAYFNAMNPAGICGRKLVLDTYDTRTDNGGNQQAAAKMCASNFADIGSMSIFDSGLAAGAQQCGLPSLHAAAVTATFNRCSTCFGIDGSGVGEFSNEVYDYWMRTNKAATQKAAFLYLNQGAAAENAKIQQSVGAKRGIKWEYVAAIDVAEFNYGPYVQQLKSKGITMVQFIGGWQQAVRLLQAEQAAGYKPTISLFDPSIYEQGFLSQAGALAEGSYMYMLNTALDEDQPEMNLYRQWLGQAVPGASPTFFGIFAWSAAKLFTETAVRLGGGLNRAAMVKSLLATNDWKGGGLHPPQTVGAKHPSSCIRYMVIKGGRFVPASKPTYTCGGYSKAS